MSEPFERGYAHTLGNALRRILLSSMHGFAPTEVSIAGVLHEYSRARRRSGGYLLFLLNLKGVVLKPWSRRCAAHPQKKVKGLCWPAISNCRMTWKW